MMPLRAPSISKYGSLVRPDAQIVALETKNLVHDVLDGSDGQRHRINEYAILLVFPGAGPAGMCEVFLGMVDVACGDAQEMQSN